MEKKIQKKQSEIDEAKKERAIKKIKYDSMIVILEGQRNTVKELETRSEASMKEYVESDNHVNKLISERDQLIQQIDQNESE